jgi:hypothetical protein
VETIRITLDRYLGAPEVVGEITKKVLAGCNLFFQIDSSAKRP